MSEFEVTRLYATIVPKLSKNFESDLNRQIQRAQQRIKPTVTFGLKVNQRSVQSVANQLNHIARDRQAAIKVGLAGEKLAAGKLTHLARKRNSDVKVNLISAIAQAKVDNLARDRTVKLKVDLDKNNLSGVRQGIGGIASGAGGVASGIGAGVKGIGQLSNVGLEAIAGGIEGMGFAFGRMSDVAGIAGVALTGVARIMKGVASVGMSAAQGTAAFGAAMAEAAATAGVTLVVGAIVAALLGFVAAIAVATLATVGFAIAAVFAGAVVAAFSVAVGGIAIAATSVMGALGALGGALLVVGLALAPLMEAFSEFMSVEKEAAKESNTAAGGMKKQAAAIAASAGALRSANTAVRNAQQGVQDAQRGIILAQRGVDDAQRAVRDSGERLTDSIRNQQRAREGLNQAEERARRNLEDLRRLARDASGENEDAELRLIRAREELAAINPVDNDLTDYREKLRAVERAERDVADTRQDGADAVKDYEKERKKGVKGSDEVISAQDRLVQANRDVRDSSEAASDAHLRLRDAEYQVTKAVNEHREAELRLQDAMLDRAEAGRKHNDVLINGADAADTSTSAQRKLKKMLGELTAEGVAFFEVMKSGWSWVKRLSAIAQRAFLPGLTEAFKSMKTLAPVVEKGVDRMGKTLGRVATNFGKWFGSSEGAKVFDTLFKAADGALKIMGDTGLEMTKILLPALAQLMRDGEPVLKALGGALIVIAQGFAILFREMGTAENVKSMSTIVRGFGVIIGDLIAIFAKFMTVSMMALARDMPAMIDGVSRLAQGFFDMLKALMSSGLVAGFARFMGLIGEALTVMANNGTIQLIGEAMGEMLVVLGQGIKDLASNEDVQRSLLTFVRMLPGLIAEFLKYLPVLMEAIFLFANIAVRITKLLSPEIIGALMIGMYTVIGLITSLLVIVILIKDKWREAWTAMTNVFNFFMGIVGPQLKWIAENVFGWLKPLAKAIGLFGDGEDAKKANDLTTAIDGTGVAALSAEGKFAGLEGQLVGVNSQFDLATTKSLTLGDAVDQLRNKMSAEAAAAQQNATVTQTWKTRKDELSKSIQANGTQIAGNTVEAIKNRDAFKLATQASYDRMLADIKSGVPMQQAIDRHRDRTNALKDEFGKSKIAKDETDKLVKKYGEVPKDISTLLKTLGYDDVDKKLKEILIQQQAGRIGTNGKPQGLVEAKRIYEKQERIAFMADGGAVRGPGGGRADKVPAMLSNGEFVQPTHIVKHYGRGVMEALRSRAIPKDMLIKYPKYAKGGLVDWPFTVDLRKGYIPKLESAAGDAGNLVGSGGSGTAGGFQNMFNWIKSKVPGANLTSGLRPGDPGYHGRGRAIDLTFNDGSERRGGGMAAKAFNLIKTTFMKNIKELIWDFAKGNAVWNGQNHFFSGGGAGPGTHNDHIHWAMKQGGLVSGAGGEQTDRILRMLSNGEFVMSAAATKAIGPRNLAAANQLGSRSTSSTPRGTLGIGNHFDQGGQPNFVDQSRNVQMDVYVTEPAHADLVVHRVNSLM